MFRPQNVLMDNQHVTSSMSVAVHPSQEVSNMSNVSTTRVVRALNSVGVEIQSSLISVWAVMKWLGETLSSVCME